MGERAGDEPGGAETLDRNPLGLLALHSLLDELIALRA
jgi:hypothetical protein